MHRPAPVASASPAATRAPTATEAAANTPTPPRPLPTTGAFIALNLGVQTCMAVDFLSFAWLAEPTPSYVRYAAHLQSYILWVVACTSLASMVYLGWLIGPLQRLRTPLRRGDDPLDHDPGTVRRALTVFRPLAWFTFACWALPSLAWPAVSRVLRDEDPQGLAWRHALIGVLAAVVVTCVVYAALYLFTAYRVSPALLARGSIEKVKPVRLVRVWQLVVAIVVVLGIVQPLMIATLLSSNTPSPLLMVHTWGITLGVALLAAGAGLVGISRTAGHLAGRMAEVREGNLDTQARIDNLDTFGQLASDFNAMVEGLRQREFIRETFGRYVSRQIADEILGGKVELGGELRTATVLFSDIRGFTQMSERMPPAEVVAFLNRYLDIMVDCVFRHGGVLDKFIGDAVMAVWGVPVSKGDPARDALGAVRGALDMCVGLDNLNAARRAVGLTPIEIGIGLHTGPVVAGNIGSKQFMEYTVIGDTVNLTSRLEGMTKTFGRRILLSETTAKLVEEHVTIEHVDEVPVRGREAPVRVYTVKAGLG